MTPLTSHHVNNFALSCRKSVEQYVAVLTDRKKQDTNLSSGCLNHNVTSVNYYLFFMYATLYMGHGLILGPQGLDFGNINSLPPSDTSGFLQTAGFDTCDHMTVIRNECS